MSCSFPIRRSLVLAALLSGAAVTLSAQTQPTSSAPQGNIAKPSAAVSELPTTPPTSMPATSFQQNSATNRETPKTAAPRHHVEVSYTDGKLAVEATNAGLNEVLREVSRKTGMKITGGVADDRVFGNYGPSAPAVVLDALLEGTGSNILLINDAKGRFELVLTPRRGGVTPPNPEAATQANENDEGLGQYIPPIRPFQPPVASGRGPITVGDTQGIAPNGGDQSESNGNQTPQQIYEQLQRAMQQQKQTPNTPQD